MPSLDVKSINLSKCSMQLIKSTNHNYQDVFCSFTYNKTSIEKIVIVPVKSGASSTYYYNAAREQLNNELKSGELVKYCKRYIRKGKYTSTPAFKVCLIACAALLVIGGGTGAFFLGKFLNGGGGSEDGLITVSFDASSTDEHPAYFNGDKNLHRLEFMVGKGIKFGDIKKLATNLTRIDHIDDKTKEELVYDSLDYWSDSTSKVDDERVLNDNISVSASYKKDKVKLILDAGGNSYGAINIDPDASQSEIDSVERTVILDVDKGTTLYDALNLHDNVFIKPQMIKLNNNEKFEYDDTYNFTFFRDPTGQLDLFPPDTEQTSKKDDYKNYIIDHDVVLTANYSGIPSGDPITYLDVTFYATIPGITDRTEFSRIGYFANAQEEMQNVLVPEVITKKQFSFNSPGEETMTFKEIVDKIPNMYKKSIGEFGSFDYWDDLEGNHLDPDNPDDTHEYERNFALYAHYTPNFVNDTWKQIAAVGSLGKNAIIKAYNLDNEGEIYTLEKDITLANNAKTRVRVIGLNADYQEAYPVFNPYNFYDDDDIYGCVRKPAALTLQFIEPVGNKISWGVVREERREQDFNALYYEDGCNIKTALSDTYNLLPKDLQSVINDTAKIFVTDREEIKLKTMDEEFFGVEKLFLIGGKFEAMCEENHDFDGPDNPQYILFNEFAKNPLLRVQCKYPFYTNFYGTLEKDKVDYKDNWMRWNTNFREDYYEKNPQTDEDYWSKDRNMYWLELKEGRICPTHVPWKEWEHYQETEPYAGEHYIFPAFTIGNGIL